jgi:hypothetical protein
VLIVVTSANAYRYVLRNVLMYWLGTIVFGAGALQAASYHHGPVANVWGAVALAGWLASVIGLLGLPPRKPIRRIQRAR